MKFNQSVAGGSYLSKKKNCYVVSVGSGSPIIDVSDSIVTHLVGTGMGAGTIFGLSSIYARTDSVESINVLAETGTGERLNLVIDDIYDPIKLFKLSPSYDCWKLCKTNTICF